jgi:branched-chain amino acid transport system ATP-binding protein
MTMLRVENVSAGYGQVLAISGINLEVAPGEIVAVVGANGAGKSTLLRAVAGLVESRTGAVTFDGTVISTLPAHAVVGRGIALVAEGGRLFPFMTVQENLELGAFHATARKRLKQSLEEVMDLFPILAERRRQLAGRLSGGERQMCAIARAVMSGPRLLMLDEPSLGLSPILSRSVLKTVREVANRGTAVLLVEQNARQALAIADRACVIETGSVVLEGDAATLAKDERVQKAYLGGFEAVASG